MVRKLKRVGYFEELDHGGEVGDKLTEVISEQDMANKNEIISYLKNGVSYIIAAGVVRSYFDDEIIGGLCILTDGVWEWPSDLVYYVEKYNVRLPEEFVEHMKCNDWTVPEVTDITQFEE